ncbi:MAG TPA: hypothetical protein VF712_02605 [Thermoleophilaceae bacterium]
MTATAPQRGALWHGRWLIAQALVTVPLVAVIVSAYSPEVFRSSATLSFSGHNTGSRSGDVEQARNAVLNDRSMAERALSVTGVTGLGAAELQDEVDIETSPFDGTLELAVSREERDQARALSAEYTRQLARDQFATVIRPAADPVKVAPLPARNGLVALGAALPFGVMLALGHDAVRRRRSHEA